MEAFRETRLRRTRRQAVTIGRAVRAGRARAKAAPQQAPPVNGTALCDLVGQVAATAQLVEIPVNRPPWTSTRLQADTGDQLTWLAWGFGYVVRSLGIGAGPPNLLHGRVGGGAVQASARDTYTFTADGNGNVELASLFPGEMRADGSIATDRTPYRMMRGSLAAVVARWAPGSDPREALDAVADRDPSGLCAAEAARLADPPKPPPGWDPHPLLAPAEVYVPSDRGMATHVHETVGIVRRPAEAPLTSTLRLRWSWRLDALPSELPEDTALTHDYLSVASRVRRRPRPHVALELRAPRGVCVSLPARPLAPSRDARSRTQRDRGPRPLGRRGAPCARGSQGGDRRAAAARVVRAWLISVGFFQRGEGRGEFGRIELVDGDETVRIL